MRRLALTLLLGATAAPAFAGEPARPAGKPGIKVEVAPSAPADAAAELAKALADAKATLAKARDYTGHLARVEQVRGVTTPETVAEIRVRNEPFAIALKTVRPVSLAGEETSYEPTRSRLHARFKPAGVAGVKGFRTVDVGGPEALEHARHPASGYGLAAMLDRVEQFQAVERTLRNPVAVYASDYKLGDQAVTRYEVVAPRAHAGRVAYKVVIFLDPATKLPARFEAYDAPTTPGGDGTLIEMQAVVGVKTNVGLGESSFRR